MSTTTIQDLSPEMLVEIFSHYINSAGHMEFSRNLAPVCKTWWTLSSAPSLWKSIDLWNLNYAVSISERGLLCHTQRINIHAWFRDTLLIMAVLSNVRDLKYLKIWTGTIDACAMIVLARLCPNLEYLYVESADLKTHEPTIHKEFGPILKKCGPQLKGLGFIGCRMRKGKELVTEIADKCPSLEVFQCVSNFATVPIHKLASGCPRLRKVVLDCNLVYESENDCSELKDLTEFSVVTNNFHGIDVCSLLKNSNNLELLDLHWNENLILSDFSKIPSNKVRHLKLSTWCYDEKDINFMALKQAVEKWKHTLLYLNISNWRCNVTCVLEILLDSNPCPKLEFLAIHHPASVDKDLLKIFILKCENLKELSFNCYQYRNRGAIMQFRDLL